jgi:hypothetical protein
LIAGGIFGFLIPCVINQLRIIAEVHRFYNDKLKFLWLAITQGNPLLVFLKYSIFYIPLQRKDYKIYQQLAERLSVTKSEVQKVYMHILKDSIVA